jgi:hypothetical protein
VVLKYTVDELLSVLPPDETPAATTTPSPLPPKLAHGKRHTLLFKQGCRLRQQGWEKAEIADALWSLLKNRNDGPEVPRKNIDGIAADICKRYAAGIRTNDPAPTRNETVEDLHAFLARMDQQPAPSWLIEGLIPDEGICLWHGQPRDFKSMCAQEVALALAAGRPAFALPRFDVRCAVRVGFFTEEDPERLFAARMRWLTAKNPRPAVDMFFPFVRQSLSIDVPEDREFILRTIRKLQLDVAVFDPMRSYTGLSDKGPADLRPVTIFLRQIQNETTCKVLLIVHHDTKPPAFAPADGQDRSRSQNASGGGIFSISDCPVSFTKLEWNQVAVYPEDYKLSGNPKPFEVTFESDVQESDNGPRFGTWVLPTAVTKDEHDIADDMAKKKILSFLQSRVGEWFSTDEVQAHAKAQAKKVGHTLEELRDEGAVLFCTGDDAKALGRSAKAKLWSGVPEPKPRVMELEF